MAIGAALEILLPLWERAYGARVNEDRQEMADIRYEWHRARSSTW
jgi:hypothetical protein